MFSVKRYKTKNKLNLSQRRKYNKGITNFHRN